MEEPIGQKYTRQKELLYVHYPYHRAHASQLRLVL